jgi:hypothetical protein
MKITLTPEESETYFHNALCNGLDYIDGYGIGLKYSKQEYNQAKEKHGLTCYEDVLIQILKDGGTLTMMDYEGDETQSITLQDVHERVQNTVPNHLMNMISENDDAETADVILQTVFYNEIIFG